MKRTAMRLPYRLHRAKVAAVVLRFVADYYVVPAEQICEETLFSSLERDLHDQIRFMLWIEDSLVFAFPDDLRTRTGRLKQCRADTIKTLKELIDFIARLPGNKPK